MCFPLLGDLGFSCWRPERQSSAETGTSRGLGDRGHLETRILWCPSSTPKTSHSSVSGRTSVMIRSLIATVTFIHTFAGDLLISVPPVSACRRPCIAEFLLRSGEKWREQMGLWLIFQCWIYKKIFCQTLHSSLWDEINPMNKIANLT